MGVSIWYLEIWPTCCAVPILSTTTRNSQTLPPMPPIRPTTTLFRHATRATKTYLQHNIPQPIQDLILTGLCQGCTTGPNTTFPDYIQQQHILQPAIVKQSEIGRKQLYYGCIATAWHTFLQQLLPPQIAPTSMPNSSNRYGPPPSWCTTSTIPTCTPLMKLPLNDISYMQLSHKYSTKRIKTQPYKL